MRSCTAFLHHQRLVLCDVRDVLFNPVGTARQWSLPITILSFSWGSYLGNDCPRSAQVFPWMGCLLYALAEIESRSCAGTRCFVGRLRYVVPNPNLRRCSFSPILFSNCRLPGTFRLDTLCRHAHRQMPAGDGVPHTALTFTG